MNQDKTDPDDQRLHEAFRDVREIEIPARLKAQCLAAAQRGLASADTTQPLQLKQTRSQAFKLPVAIAASLLIGFGLGWLMRDKTTQNVNNDYVVNKPQPTFNTPPANVNATSIIDFDETGSEKSFFVSETYLCGVGRIQSKSSYGILGDQK